MTSLQSTLKTAKASLPKLQQKRDNILAQIADAENTIATLEKAGVGEPADPAAAPGAPVEQH